MPTKLPAWLKDPDVVLLRPLTSTPDRFPKHRKVHAQRIYDNGKLGSTGSINRALWWVVSLASDTRTHELQVVITPMLGTDLRYRGHSDWVPYVVALDQHHMSAHEWLERFTS